MKEFFDVFCCHSGGTEGFSQDFIAEGIHEQYLFDEGDTEES